MVFNVLIALKDEKIRQNLASYIDWEKMDCELIASCSDGLVAQRLTKTLKPDIVITQLDIKGVYLLLSDCPIYHTAIFGEGEKEESEIEKAFGLGIYRYQQKPITLEKISYQLLDIVNLIKKEKSRQIESTVDNPTLNLPTYSNNMSVLAAINFIEQNYNKNIGLQEASSVIKMSEAHLSRIFKKETGLNYVRYLNIYRINVSIELMYNENLTLNQIGTACGFETQSYFAKIFKRELNVTPSKYRESFILYNKK
ncbi:MAG: response regulator transcription factor [Sphaerochaeta sp.]